MTLELRLAGMRTFILCLMLSCTALACINEYEPTGTPSTIVFGTYEPRDWQARVDELAGRTDFNSRNDYAVALMRVNRAPEAVKLLEALETEKPGEYIVAANLGTAYELSGDLEQAHLWIEEGIKRNPDAHAGTEWLHLRILEARRHLEDDPRWLESHRVLSPQDRTGVLEALRYQLHERMWFVKPPDPVVADLLVELASILDKPGNEREAAEMYQLALNYEPQQRKLAVERRNALAEHVRDAEDGKTDGGTAIGSSLLGVLGLLGLLWVLSKLRA